MNCLYKKWKKSILQKEGLFLIFLILAKLDNYLTSHVT